MDCLRCPAVNCNHKLLLNVLSCKHTRCVTFLQWILPNDATCSVCATDFNQQDAPEYESVKRKVNFKGKSKRKPTSLLCSSCSRPEVISHPQPTARGEVALGKRRGIEIIEIIEPEVSEKSHSPEWPVLRSATKPVSKSLTAAAKKHHPEKPKRGSSQSVESAKRTRPVTRSSKKQAAMPKTRESTRPKAVPSTSQGKKSVISPEQANPTKRSQTKTVSQTARSNRKPSGNKIYYMANSTFYNAHFH